jgi:peptidyl-prolyl cis-trans isomerase D
MMRRAQSRQTLIFQWVRTVTSLMLDAIRKRTASFVVKLLMGVLALSFALWGIGDMFTGGQDPAVAEVGGTKITASQLQAEYARTLDYWQRATGGQIDAEQARAFGIVNQALETLVTRALLRQEVEAIGIGAPDSRVREMITSNESFRSPAGIFDRTIYQAVLRQNRLTEDQYEIGIREDYARGQLMDSLASGLVTPKIAVDTIREFRGEERTAAIVMVTPDNAPDAPAPDDATIQAFYADNENLFMAPEYRTVTLVSLRPADLLDEIDVSDEDVRQDYDYRIDSYTTPHLRNVDRLVFDSAELAESAFERLMGGDDFLAVGRDLAGQGDADMRLGMVTREDFPDAATADAVFGLTVGQVGKPIETAFGWRIFRVTEDSPGGIQAFEDVAEEIRMERKISAASDAVFDLSNRLEDERAGGATLTEAASALGIDAQIIGPIDRFGLDREGTASETLPMIPEFIEEAFKAGTDIESNLLESVGNIFYVLRVDDVVPGQLKPLDTVRDDVIAAWQADWRDGQSKVMAEGIAERIGAGETIYAVAESVGILVDQTGTFTRDGGDQRAALPPALIDAIFTREAGKATGAIDTGGGRYAIAVVGEVLPWTPASLTPDSAGHIHDEIRDQLDQGTREDIAIAYDSALRKKYGVSINQSLVDNFIQ